MRTQEQINTIKKYEQLPRVHEAVVSNEKTKFLLDYYHNSNDVIEKNTGPKVLFVKQGEDIIDDIIEKLQKIYGRFNVRSAHFFDVTQPHIIHNDDHKSLPNSYRAFTIPLWADGKDSDIGLVMYEQFYYHGPAKFINGETEGGNKIYYNEFIRDYKNVDYLSTDKIINTDISHLRSHWLEGLSIYKILPWKIGNILSFESLRLHSSTDFNSKGISRKIGISIFTTIEEKNE